MCTLDSVFDDDELRMKTERLVRGHGKSETTNIEARCATVVGKTVFEALQTEIIGVDSTVRKYSRADLDYDLARGLLVILVIEQARVDGFLRLSFLPTTFNENVSHKTSHHDSATSGDSGNRFGGKRRRR